MGGRSIVVAAEEPIGCPKCGHGFALSEGISRQAIERHAEDYERALGAGKKRLEAALTAEARAQFDIQFRAAREALAARESVLDKFKVEELARVEAKTRASIGDEFSRREAQLKARIESAQREAADLKRKLEQGSQQTQGWSGGCIPKLKDDQQRVGAELAVLVSSAMPLDTREPFLREGDVWVARFEAARPLAEALRATLLEMHKLRVANAGRSEKMELVYNYVCSPQFAQRVRSKG